MAGNCEKKFFPAKKRSSKSLGFFTKLWTFLANNEIISLSLSLSLSLNHQHTNTPNYTAHNTLVALHLILSLSLHRIRLSNTRFLYDSLSMIHLPIATHFLTQQQRISYTLSLSISFVSLFCIYILAISLSSLSLSFTFSAILSKLKTGFKNNDLNLRRRSFFFFFVEPKFSDFAAQTYFPQFKLFLTFRTHSLTYLVCLTFASAPTCVLHLYVSKKKRAC